MPDAARSRSAILVTYAIPEAADSGVGHMPLAGPLLASSRWKFTA